MSAYSPLQLLVHSIADQHPQVEFLREKDMRDINERELAIVLNADEIVGQAAFSASTYAEILNSSIYQTDAEKALAFWQRLKISAMTAARDFLCSEVNSELCERMPVDEPDMPATEARWTRPMVELFPS